MLVQRSIELSLDGGGKDVSFCVLDCSVKKQVVLIVVRPGGGIGWSGEIISGQRKYKYNANTNTMQIQYICWSGEIISGQ